MLYYNNMSIILVDFYFKTNRIKSYKLVGVFGKMNRSISYSF